LLLLALTGAAVMGAVGCKTNSEDNNDSSLPWDKPKPWENGMGGMNERR